MSPADAERERRTFAARVSILFAAISVLIGTNLPYFPIWLDWVGLSTREIAVVTAAPLVARVAVTPIIGFAADRAGDHRRFLIGLSWAGLAALVALAQSRGFWLVLAWTLLFAVAWATVMPLTETVAMSGVRAAGLDYGRMRLWGSLSFIAATLAGGWIVEQLGAASAIWLVVGGAVLTTLAAHALVRPIGLGRLKAATSPPRLSRADALGLLRSRGFLLFLLAVGATQAAHAMFYTFGTLHWRALGLSTGWSGALWAISIVCEVGLFAFSRAVFVRLGARQLILMGAAAAVVRWTAMGFDPPLAMLVPLQILHALTFAATHLGAMHYIAETVPEAQAGTAQSLYASVTGGIAMGSATLLSGPLYAAFAGRGYWAMALIAAIALAASLALWRTPKTSP
jgi:MFS transporter, PPP family, 3-phenylpropionic acid transporter